MMTSCDFAEEAMRGLGRVKIETSDGIHFALWDHHLQGDLSIDPSEIYFLQNFISEGDLVIDIGAHCGDTALPLALAAGKTGRCVAFEPNPEVYPVLCLNAWLNQHQCHIIPVNRAVMEKEGSYIFHYCDPGHCNGGYATSLSAGIGVCGHSHELQVEAVELIPFLNRAVPELLSRLSLIKLDTEGYDAALLGDNAELIQQHRPVIITELFPGLNRQERIDWYEAIRDLGYTPHLTNHAVRIWDEYRPMTLDDAILAKGVIDAVCLPD